MLLDPLPAALGVGCLIVALFMPTTIRSLNKQNRTTEINIIFYAFSLTFVVRFAVDLAAILSGFKDLSEFLEHELGIPRTYSLWLHHWLTDIFGEMKIATAIIVVAIAPQLLAYMLAGAFGCAQEPRLVWAVERFVVWSLIKFFAALSGILTELAISLTTISIASSDTIYDRLLAVGYALFALEVAFVFAFLQTRFVETPIEKVRLSRLQRFLTRNMIQTNS